jgi:hypothetical protein
MRYTAYYDWGLGDLYENYANEASARGDWLGVGYYNYMSAKYDHAGDLISAAMDALGC